MTKSSSDQPTVERLSEALQRTVAIKVLPLRKLTEQLLPAERKMLPEVQATVDALYRRAFELARTLHAMDGNITSRSLAQVEERLAAAMKEPEDAERERRIDLLQ